VVTFHGNASLPEWHAERFMAGPWRRHGWGVMAPAYARRPGPGRDRHRDRRAEGVAVQQHRRPGRAPSRLGPFDSMTAMARHHFRLLPAGLLADTWRSDRAIAAVGIETWSPGSATKSAPAIRARRAPYFSGITGSASPWTITGRSRRSPSRS
jgi:hypothetical protein